METVGVKGLNGERAPLVVTGTAWHVDPQFTRTDWRTTIIAAIFLSRDRARSYAERDIHRSESLSVCPSICVSVCHSLVSLLRQNGNNYRERLRFAEVIEISHGCSMILVSFETKFTLLSEIPTESPDSGLDSGYKILVSATDTWPCEQRSAEFCLQRQRVRLFYDTIEIRSAVTATKVFCYTVWVKKIPP